MGGLAFLRSGLGKSQALLVYLAMERSTRHRRAALAELFWPEQPPARGRHRLRQMLMDLQKELRERGLSPLLALDKESVRFCADAAWLDVAEFTADGGDGAPALADSPDDLAKLESRVALYRGEFMAGLALPDCPAFEDWLLWQRERLLQRALALLEQLSNGHERAGNGSQALRFALRHIELSPWDECAHRRAMLLFALNGQDAAALHQYETCRQVLETELGALPSKETRSLAERIRHGEFRRETVAPPARVPSLSPLPVERRQVTALYCELSQGKTADPEEAMALLSAPQARCMEIIRQFSGYIVQTHGGSLLAYFGYPRADEYAARHAVQAALAAASGDGVEVHVGVHSGLIIAGGDPAMPDVVGKTSKIAIHLRQHAAANGVAISADTLALVAGYFDCASLGKHPLPGVALPLEIFQVVRESGAQSRLEAAARLTAFTGRKALLDRLESLWKDAERGERRTVLLQGEPGKGKSRLLLALKERLADRPHAIRELRCFPEFSQSPFHPLIATLEVVFGLDHGDTHEEKFAKLVRYLETRHPAKARDAAPLLASLLSLPVAAPYRMQELTPQQQKEGIIETLLDLLLAASAQRPVLLAVEDLHWVDPSTLEFLSRFLQLKRKAAILTVLTARPEFDPPWPAALDWQLRLSPLSRTDAKKMVAAINRRLPPEVVAQIVERSDGVPLFIEEMSKAASADDHAAVPATLNDLLAARLEATGEAKAVAQLAATIGREFDEELLHKVALLDAGLLARALGRLEDSGLVLPLSSTSRQFKHALIQEAAYQSQTRADRQSAHHRIAQALQDDFPDVAANSPEVLAQHWSAAGDAAKAVFFWQLAGRHAVDRFAYKEALSHYAACERQLAMLPPGKERDRQEFDLLTSWSRAEQMAAGFGVESSMELLRRATVLLEQGIGDARDVFQLQWGRWETTGANLGHHESAKIAELLMDIAKRENDRPLLLQAHYAMGVSLFWTGQIGQAHEHLEQSVALEDQDIKSLTRSAYGHVMVVGASSYLSWALWLLGERERAFVVSRDTVALAHHSESLTNLAYALTFAATLHRWDGNVEETLRLAEEGRKAATHSNNQVFDHVLAVTSAWAAVKMGDPAAIAKIRMGIDVIRQAYGAATVSLLALFADALLHLGRGEEALPVVDETLQLAKEKHDLYLLAELQRLRGTCFLMRGDTETARQCFEAAIAIGLAQGSVALEHNARASLASLTE